jgi:hypothetical protein
VQRTSERLSGWSVCSTAAAAAYKPSPNRSRDFWEYLSSNQVIELPLTGVGGGVTLTAMVVASTPCRGHLGWLHFQTEQPCASEWAAVQVCLRAAADIQDVAGAEARIQARRRDAPVPE